jgi:hypothetical protein
MLKVFWYAVRQWWNKKVIEHTEALQEMSYRQEIRKSDDMLFVSSWKRKNQEGVKGKGTFTKNSVI